MEFWSKRMMVIREAHLEDAALPNRQSILVSEVEGDVDGAHHE
jgi:hypothetical protein